MKIQLSEASHAAWNRVSRDNAIPLGGYSDQAIFDMGWDAAVAYLSKLEYEGTSSIEERLKQSIEHLRVIKAIDGRQDAQLYLAMSRMMSARNEIIDQTEEVLLLQATVAKLETELYELRRQSKVRR